MNNQELIYDIDELNATISLAEKIIKALNESVDVLTNPSKHHHEQVSEEYVFILNLGSACDYNQKINERAARHCMSSQVPGFRTRNEGEKIRHDINPIFECDEEKGAPKEFIDFLRGIIAKHDKE